MDKSLSSASNTLMVLAVISRNDCYGYEIITLLKKYSNNIFELQEGTLYPLLHTLEKKGLVTSYKQTLENGKVRKYYHITEDGRRTIESKRTEWIQFTDAVNTVLGGTLVEHSKFIPKIY